MSNPPQAIIEVFNPYISTASGSPGIGWQEITGDVMKCEAKKLGWNNGVDGTASVGELDLTLYNAPRFATSGTMLNGTITAAATTLIATNAISFLVGQMIRIDTEYMQITAISGSTLTVVRGVYYTAAAAHTNGATIYLYAPAYNPRPQSGNYSSYQQAQTQYAYLLEDGVYVRVRYSGLLSGRCMKAYNTSSPNVPSGGTIAQVLPEAVVASQVWTLRFDARAQYDYQGNADSVVLNTANSGTPTVDSWTSAFNYTNKWVTYTVFLATTVTANQVIITFSPGVGVGTRGDFYIEYRNVTLTCPTIAAGANQAVNGYFQSGSLNATPPSWAVSAGSDGLTALTVNDTYIGFYGRVENIEPQPFASSGTPPLCKVTCLGLFHSLEKASVSPPPAIQHNIRTDQIVSLALAYAIRNWPGQQIDTGLLTPPGTSMDKYTAGRDKVSRVIDDATISEYGMFNFDRDGTLRFHSRVYRAIKMGAGAAPALVMTENAGYTFHPSRDTSTIYNRVRITSHPRTRANPVNPLFIATPPLTIPGKQTNGPGILTVVAAYHDLYGAPCGADNVRQLIPYTPGITDYDYWVTDNPNANMLTGPAAVGYNYTATQWLQVSMTVGARQATITFQNTATGNLYVNFLRVMGQAITTYDEPQVYVGEGTSATGSIVGGSQPVAGDTVNVNGVLFTFETLLTTAGQVLIGATTLASMLNLYNAMVTGPGQGLNYASSTPPAPANCTYGAPSAANSNTIAVAYIETGTQGNAFTLARTGTGGITVSGPTLTGGQSISKALYNVNDYEKDFPIADDPVFVNAVAQWLLSWYAYPTLDVNRIDVQYEEGFTLAASTLNGLLSSSATSVSVVSALSFYVGNIVQIDQEYMFVSAVDKVGMTLTCIRGWIGTAAASHSSGATVNIVTDYMALEAGDLIAVNSFALGMYNARHMITAVSYVIDPNAGRPLESIAFEVVRLDRKTVAIWGDGIWTWEDQVSVWYI